MEFYSDDNTAARLLANHKNAGDIELQVSECVDPLASNIPMPNTIIRNLKDRITSLEERAVVTGIDAYLVLLSKDNVKAFMIALREILEENKLNSAYIISNSLFDPEIFNNPKYENSQQIVFVGEVNQPPLSQDKSITISIVPQKWVVNSSNPTNWQALLKRIGKFKVSGDFVLELGAFSSKLSGLSNIVSQLIDAKSVAIKIYGITDSIATDALEYLMKLSKQRNEKPLDVMRASFGLDNLTPLRAIKRLYELRNDLLWPAYIWFLRKTIDRETYLAYVLSTDIANTDFLQIYVCERVIEILGSKRAAGFAQERAAAIKEMGSIADPYIAEFIESVKPHTDKEASFWLNCGTRAEQIEIVRRVSASDLSAGLPKVWHDIYPLLADYLSDEYDFADDELADYFREYRCQKIMNSVSLDFVDKAFSFARPQDISMRDSILCELSADRETALLFIDGMGAEYYPLILAQAKRRGLSIETARVAGSKLPTSTEFNRIEWDGSRLLEQINEIDNISHNGAVKHESSSPHRNLVATLAVFDDIINRVIAGLKNYRRVVLTADHGSSRLAVLAHEAGLSKTLAWEGNPLDWRYSIEPLNAERSSDFESYYDAEKNVTYWVVRGYNRLPKQGGKLYSLHGGATSEERLVPVIVFTKEAVESSAIAPAKQKTEMLIERDDFDI
jgi:hypothetical protein